MRLPVERAEQVLRCLLEGASVRSTERMTGVNRNTILSLLVVAGEKCSSLLDERMRGLRLQSVECDELWGFVSKKQRHVRASDPAEFGDAWVFIALDADTKLIPCFQIGKRTKATTYDFIRDLSERVVGRIQLTTDGFRFYIDAVDRVFGADVDFSQLVKLYGDYGQHNSEAKYSPSPIIEVLSRVLQENPNPERISTSYVERHNLTMRMHLRRLTRLTNAFSRKLDNLKAAVALQIAYYNLCRIHQSLRVTPAMEAGITDHVWSVRELLESAA